MHKCYRYVNVCKQMIPWWLKIRKPIEVKERLHKRTLKKMLSKIKLEIGTMCIGMIM